MNKDIIILTPDELSRSGTNIYISENRINRHSFSSMGLNHDDFLKAEMVVFVDKHKNNIRSLKNRHSEPSSHSMPYDLNICSIQRKFLYTLLTPTAYLTISKSNILLIIKTLKTEFYEPSDRNWLNYIRDKFGMNYDK